MSIPFDLRQAIETGTAILFVGAGMGYNMVTSEGEHVPDGARLAKMIADKFSVPCGDSTDLQKISQYVVTQKGGKAELCVFVREVLEKALPDEAMLWIPTVRWKAIFTTNYDNCIEKAYDQCSSPAQQYVTISHLSGMAAIDSSYQVPIIHLHGSLLAEKSPEIIITQQDFVKYKEKRSSLFGVLKVFMASSCILYTGYSHNDPNFSSILTDLEEELYPDTPKHSYRIDPYTSELDRVILEQRKLTTIGCTFTEFINRARLEISSVNISDETFRTYESAIPDDFSLMFKMHPAPTVRLFSSWDYVSRLSANTGMSLHSYLCGSKADWGIIFKDLYFHRSIEDEIYDSIIDYVTDPQKRTATCVVLAPAGYGTSTLLKSLAKRLVSDRVAEVYFHNSSREYREGDVLFACTKSPDEKHVFFIDDAANNLSKIKSTIIHTSEARNNCLFVLGERINEWQQKRVSLKGNYFNIQPLDDAEIEILLDFLRDNHELNKLAELTREHQIAAIKKNYNRELLVAIREATEGKSFDAIIQDEYFNIDSTFAKKVYALVSCFHQYGALLRVDLLAKLMKADLTDVYEQIKDPLDGIIDYEEISDGITGYAIRSRHRIISSIVWNRCLSGGDHDTILHEVIDNLNIAFRLDKEAFDQLVYEDQVVDSLSSDESKDRFFERACRMDPDNPFVRQHYARMLVRTKRLTPALAVIDQAISMDPRQSMLYHTRGLVLHNMAMSAESIDIGRRYLGQSEESYNIALSKNSKDAYCYRGLANLYLEWAKRDVPEDERTLYLSNAELAVQNGLQNARDKEYIWIASAEIDAFVGNMPNKIHALNMAVQNAPNSIISRYLLARALIDNCAFDQAEELLKGIIYDSPNEYRSAIEYAKLILLTKKNIPHAIAVLQQSTMYGNYDGRFIAMLSGLLFLNKQFSDAEKTSAESARKGFLNARKVLFGPIELGLDCESDAKVVYVGAGYSRVQINGYTQIRCNSSKYQGVILRVGMIIRVSLEFTPEYPVARIISV